MQKYLALLRAVNVSGKNKVVMSVLKKAFEDYGFCDVSSYINSGNIIFSTTETDEKSLAESCGKIIKEIFKLDIPVMIISDKDFLKGMLNAPDWWGKAENTTHNVAFLLPPAKAEEIIIWDIVPSEPEKVYYYEQLIFWSAPLATFSRTRFSKLARSEDYKKVTIRNANTATKLAALILDEKGTA